MTARKQSLRTRLKYWWRKYPQRCIVAGLCVVYAVFYVTTDRYIPLTGEEMRVKTGTLAGDGENGHVLPESDPPVDTAGSSGGWQTDRVPNPKLNNARNWVCNPDGILGWEAEQEINGILQALEDSLTVEVAVVALNAIDGDDPRDFAHRLFNTWGVGKAEDDNGLLLLLTLGLRDITFETGYGLEGVLPDALCKRIQMEMMVPRFGENDWDKGMIEGVRAVAMTLYGSGYEAAPPEAWIDRFYRTTPALVFTVFGLLLLLMNWLTWKSVVWRLRPKEKSTEAALTLLATRKPLAFRTFFGCLWLVPVWPALLAVALWYWGGQRRMTLRRSRTCPHCGKESLEPVPEKEMMSSAEMLGDHDRMELGLGTAFIRIYTCSGCGERLKLRIPLDKGCECCPACRNMTLEKKEKYRTVKKATTSSEGLKEAEHLCRYCGAKYVVAYRIPKLSTSSGGSGRGGGGRSSGGSFGGGSSGGGGSSSRF